MRTFEGLAPAGARSRGEERVGRYACEASAQGPDWDARRWGDNRWIMPHLLQPRTGWENERLAAYLLSRFSFIAHPASVADDLGSDFFCTIFEVRPVAGRQALLPRTSFAIQIKTGPTRVAMHNKIGYLNHLEMPFFLGVVSPSPPELRVYSAELLPFLLEHHGIPDQLWLRPVRKCLIEEYCRRVRPKALELRCPLVITLTASDDRAALTPKIDTLLKVCTRARANIATRISQEHLYEVDDTGSPHVLTGTGSARVFRDNFHKRLAEVFCNLAWARKNAPGTFRQAELSVYESLYKALARLGPLPQYLVHAYKSRK